MEIPDLNRQLIRCLRTLGRTIRALSEGRASQKRVLRHRPDPVYFCEPQIVYQ